MIWMEQREGEDADQPKFTVGTSQCYVMQVRWTLSLTRDQNV